MTGRRLTREFRDALMLEVHSRRCHDQRPEHIEWCAPRWIQDTRGWRPAVEHLQARRRDAAGARAVLHDAMCSSGADCGDRAAHCKTQATNVAALRAVLACPDVPVWAEGGAAAPPARTDLDPAC